MAESERTEPSGAEAEGQAAVEDPSVAEAEAVAAEAPEAADPAEQPAGEAEAPGETEAEPARSAGPPPAPPRSPQERAAERAERRRARAAGRRRWRARQRERRRERASGAPPAPTPSAQGSPGRPRVRQGVVVSDKADKTLTVRIDVTRQHRVYQKTIRESSTVHVHDERNEAHEGDTVRVVESRPLSRLKRWRLLEVLERAR